MHRLTGFLLILGVCGCTLEPRRAAIEGEVTLASGKPLPTGVIRFIPIAGTTGPIAFAEISEGKYHLEAENGPVIGSNRIEITAMRKSGEKIPIPDGPPGFFQDGEEQYLPARFNINSAITVEIIPGQNRKDVTLDEVN